MPKKSREYVKITNDALRGRWLGNCGRFLLGSYVWDTITTIAFIPLIIPSVLLAAPILAFGLSAYPLDGVLDTLLGLALWGILYIAWLLITCADSLRHVGISRFCFNLLKADQGNISDFFFGFHSILRSCGNSLLLLFRMFTLPFLFLVSGLMLPRMAHLPLLFESIMLILGLSSAAYIIFSGLTYGACFLLQVLHPEMKVRELHRYSKQIMKGNRWKLVKLNLRAWYVYLPIPILVVLECILLLLDFPYSTLIFSLLAGMLYIVQIPVLLYLSILNSAFIIDLDETVNPPSIEESTPSEAIE